MSFLPPWFESVQKAFPDKELCSRIFNAANANPTVLPQLFDDLSRYVLSSKNQQQVADLPTNPKKRKLEDGSDAVSSQQIDAKHQRPSSLTTLFDCKDVSFQAPSRKKLKLEVAADSGDKQMAELRALNPATNELEHYLPGTDIDQVFCLPQPEKQARQMNFVLFPKPGAMLADGRPAEQIVFVMNESAPTGASVVVGGLREDDTYVSVTLRALQAFLSPFHKRVITPDEKEFASSIPQSHRKGEKAYHVKGHRGSKEGYLFFLENGIVFGFKKPLAFFPFSSIESISYTSVLQRTFNLVISAMEGEPTVVKEVEFSMLDQEDFAGIDAYVKRHALNDASMAAQRRAKAYNVNKEKKVETNGEVGGGDEGDGQTELQKAEQQLQDEEDEEEEDYEASGGESDGEGEYSEDEEGYEDDAEGGEGEEGEEEAEYEEDD